MWEQAEHEWIEGIACNFERRALKEEFEKVDGAKGKLRSFLLATARHFAINEWRRRSRKKRGGHVKILSIDLNDARSLGKNTKPLFTTQNC